MRVAIPVEDDCRTPSVLRSGRLLILDVSPDLRDLSVVECRRVNATPPRHGQHRHHHEHENGHESDPEHARWHLAVLESLRDVDVVIAPQIGSTISLALKSLGKKVLTGIELSDVNHVVDVLREVG